MFIWALLQENLILFYANKEGDDQQAPLRSLTSPIVVLLDKIWLF